MAIAPTSYRQLGQSPDLQITERKGKVEVMANQLEPIRCIRGLTVHGDVLTQVRSFFNSPGREEAQAAPSAAGLKVLHDGRGIGSHALGVSVRWNRHGRRPQPLQKGSGQANQLLGLIEERLPASLSASQCRCDSPGEPLIPESCITANNCQVESTT